MTRLDFQFGRWVLPLVGLLALCIGFILPQQFRSDLSALPLPNLSCTVNNVTNPDGSSASGSQLTRHYYIRLETPKRMEVQIIDESNPWEPHLTMPVRSVDDQQLYASDRWLNPTERVFAFFPAEEGRAMHVTHRESIGVAGEIVTDLSCRF